MTIEQIQNIEDIFENFYNTAENQNIVSIYDLHLYVDRAADKITLSNENNTLIYTTDLCLSEMSNEEIDDCLKEAVDHLNNKGFFDKAIFMLPFSILHIDSKGQIIKELLMIDNDWVRVDDTLRKDIDKELDDFFTQLMQDN